MTPRFRFEVFDMKEPLLPLNHVDIVIKQVTHVDNMPNLLQKEL